ncbi:podoplanin [Rhinolophus ferrumequinum]|uniref:Podoplanin n=1 Tax=Rhinolophus ferrumequinum TaxID=59479 RepID=A0A7J7YT78_RHIFE|nr:podoplanin [Rhinolophus ferrumequinum]
MLVHKENKLRKCGSAGPLFILGSILVLVLAEGASTVLLEDDIMTPGVSEEPHQSSGLTALGPTSTEDLPTPKSTVYAREESQSTTSQNVATSHSMEKGSGETQTSFEKDGLATVILVEIIAAVLLAIGFIGGIIIVVVQKILGKCSP